MHLTTLWFVLIAVLWTGYFVLDGFDLGVGMLLMVLGRDNVDRRLCLNAIGPVWDGNEVWLLVAGGATFAAFPEWYAAMFSGFYLALLLILVGLIVRAVAFEYRGKVDTDQWRQRWDIAIGVSSFLPAFLWGVAFTNVVRGVPLNAAHHFTGTLLTLLNPISLLGGVVTTVAFALHGAVFLSLKTDGDLRHRARALANRLAAVAIAGGGLYLAIVQAQHGRAAADVLAAAAAVALIGAFLSTLRGREGWAFIATAAALAFVVCTLFADLWPNVMPSSTSAADSLTVHNASSSPYTLGVMTWVAGFATPVVLVYQAWTYWVFRKRLRRADIPGGGVVPPVPGPRSGEASGVVAPSGS
ncbi:MAG TPA: cytochrome d ubiquinol oxidase subunit II [Mycobacteriales bacterium]|nr:cytochrome d ubiquinol oxidase subunit II [Mycobacteriales bacterium]